MWKWGQGAARWPCLLTLHPYGRRRPPTLTLHSVLTGAVFVEITLDGRFRDARPGIYETAVFFWRCFCVPRASVNGFAQTW